LGSGRLDGREQREERERGESNREAEVHDRGSRDGLSSGEVKKRLD